ncbi:MAG: methyltransferase [Thermoleophilaceae bacterium]
MRIVRLPGVFPPHSDTWMLARALVAEVHAGASSVLELCAGSGAVALAAARAGASVTAVDVSRRSVATVRLNARLRRLRVDAIRGDLLAAVSGRRFDVIASNPPYLPGSSEALPARGRARAWEAGLDGRALLDRICRESPLHLNSGGLLLIVQSSVSGTGASIAELERAGLRVDVAASSSGPLGPLMRRRAADLERRGLIERGARTEELVVIRARLPGSEGPA